MNNFSEENSENRWWIPAIGVDAHRPIAHGDEWTFCVVMLKPAFLCRIFLIVLRNLTWWTPIDNCLPPSFTCADTFLLSSSSTPHSVCSIHIRVKSVARWAFARHFFAPRLFRLLAVKWNLAFFSRSCDDDRKIFQGDYFAKLQSGICHFFRRQ